MKNIIKISRSDYVKRIIIEDTTIIIEFCDKNSLAIPKKNVLSIDLEIVAIRFGYTLIEIKTSDGQIINITAQYSVIYDFIKNKNYLPEFSYKVVNGYADSIYEKMEEYKKTTMEKNIEYYIKYGKKRPLLEHIFIAVPHKILIWIIIIFLAVLAYLFLSSFL